MTDQVELGLAMAEAKKVIERYQSSRKIVDEQKQRQRLARYLARRGFSWGTIGPVVRQLFSPGTSL
jgi:SOS response regulatory protein OraA/RecX